MTAWLGGLCAAVAALLALARAELRGAPAAPGAGVHRGARGLAVALLAGLALAPCSPAWILASGDASVVEPPATPGVELLELDFDLDQVVFAVLAAYVLARLGLLVGGYLLGRRRAAAARGLAVPHGRLVLGAAAGVAGLVLVAGVGRAALGGVTPGAFATYGALTPEEGVRGWRARRLLARHLAAGAALRPLRAGPPLDADEDWHPGSDCCGALASMPGWRPRPGLAAWIAGQPVRLAVEAGEVVASPVLARDPARVPGARRPHFRATPRWAAAGGRTGGVVLVEDRPGGAIFALRLRASPPDLDAHGVAVADVGLLLRPPAWPVAVLALALLLGGGLAWRGGRRARDGAWRGPHRLAAAWILLEASTLCVAAYLPYLR